VAEHPIEGLMTTAMESIKDMVDVNTIVGDAVQAPDGTVIIPISRVAFGFAAGGGEYGPSDAGIERGKEDEEEESERTNGKFPFAGGSGAGVSINPVAFMVVGNEQIRLLPVNINTSVDRILDLLPDLFNKANEAIRKKVRVKKEIRTSDEGSKSTIEKELDRE